MKNTVVSMGSLFPDVSKNPAVKKEKKINTSSIISKQFLEEYYVPKYQELFGVPAKVNWGKDIKLLNNTIKNYSDITVFNCGSYLELLSKICDIFFTINTAYVLKNAWNIQAFSYLFQSLILQLKHRNDNCIIPIIDGYKVAYLNHYEEKFDSLIDESVFSQIYIYINTMYKTHEKHLKYSLKRFSELFFLVGFDYMGKRKYSISFFISDVSKSLFSKFLSDENNNLSLYPKDVGHIDKDMLLLEQNKRLEEDRVLFYNVI